MGSGSTQRDSQANSTPRTLQPLHREINLWGGLSEVTFKSFPEDS